MQNKNDMKKFMICLFTGITVFQAFTAEGQDGVGIGTETVDGSAILQVDANNRGVLIPRIADPVTSIPSPTNGLVVFNTSTNTFFYYSGGWNELSPMPKGAIVMWSGTTEPPGWKLCDGNDGRPDLKGQFIVGYDPADPDYNAIGKNGGSKRVGLTAAQSGVPAHFHSNSFSIGVTSSFLTLRTASTDGNGSDFDRLKREANNSLRGADKDQVSNDAHSHTITGSVLNNTPENAAEAHENRPPYYVLAYIIKI
jgi:microcystin-dependent protein